MSKSISKAKIARDWENDSAFFDDIKPMIDNSPIKAINLLRGFHRNALKGHHKRVKATILYAYACALKLKNNEKLTKKFYSRGFFNERKYKLGASNLLRMTMCYIFGSLEGSNYGQALSYERAVRPFFMREANLDELAEELSNKSLDDLEKEAKAEKDARKKDEAGQADDKSRGGKDDPSTKEGNVIAEDDEDDSDESSDKSPESEKKPQETEVQGSATVERDLDLRDLRLVSTPKLSLRIIKESAYKSGTIDYDRDDTASGFVRLIVTAVHPKA